MAKRGQEWDESKSPQWRYLLGKESELRRATNRIFLDPEGDNETERGGEIKRNKRGKKAIRERAEKKVTEKEKKLTKSGKEILYSASPGRRDFRLMK